MTGRVPGSDAARLFSAVWPSGERMGRDADPLARESAGAQRIVLMATGSRDLDMSELDFDAEMEATLARGAELAYWPAFVHVGDCGTGLDALMRSWCMRRRVSHRVHAADWAAHGRSAGPRRNRIMAAEASCDALRRGLPAVCVGWPRGVSKGTRGAMAIARQRGMVMVER